MGRHDDHLPNKDFNKVVKSDELSKKDSARLSRAQGDQTKRDAKAARNNNARDNKK